MDSRAPLIPPRYINRLSLIDSNHTTTFHIDTQITF